MLWLLAACGGPSAPPQSWSGLSSGVVTVSQPVSPPFGGPRSATYSTPEAVAGLRSALVTHHITVGGRQGTSSGCVGGVTVTLTLTLRGEKAPTQGQAYLCGGRQSGTIGGDVAGLLATLRLGP